MFAWPDPAALRRSRIAPRARSLRWSADLARPLPVAVVAAAVGALLSTPLVAALAAGCAALAARAWRARQGTARDEVRLRLLVAALAAMAADLRAGRPLEAAAVSAARGTGDDDLGRALLRAVRSSAAPSSARAGPESDALQRISAAVRLSTRTGASLADVVTAVEDDLRARQRHRLELRSAVAAPRASATLLAGLPVLGVAMGSGIGADPWHVLTETGTGQVLLVAGVGLEVAGVAWSNRLVARVSRPGAPTALP
nr:type II secretion system F family protein [Petropleomorpha daqingensis]